MRVTLIHQPGAGDDEQPDGDELQAIARAAGHEVRYQSAKEDTWAAALDEPADIVAVAGGDGTVGRVAKKLIGRDIPVAPLPFGTANNISKTLGLVDMPLAEIMVGWNTGRRIPYDVGVANGPWGTRYFLEAMGVGLFACAIPVAERSRKLASMKDAGEKVAHAVGLLRERLDGCPPHRLDIKLDGKSLSGDYVLFEAMNMEFVGPNLYLAPNLDPNDGFLDVVLVTTAERDKLHESLAHWQSGNMKHPELTRRRAQHIELKWTGYEVHVDDEAWPSKESKEQPSLKHIELEVEREALSFIAPA